MSVDMSAARPDKTVTRRSVRLLVGVDDGTLSGVNTYIECVAAAAATAVEDVTLLVAHDGLAAEVSSRLEGTGVRVISLGMEPITPAQRRRERLSPGYAARRLSAGVAAARPQIGDGYDAVHLNHPHLAAAFRPMAVRVCVAAWFYPHSAIGRGLSVWRHSGNGSARGAGLAVKGMLHQRNDGRGFRAADTVVAPTRLLAEQLRREGFNAVFSTPPARVLGVAGDDDELRRRGARPRLLICSGDLGHPRKNVALALDAAALLADRGRALELELVGGNADALRDRLDRLSSRVQVTLTGRLPAAAVHARMRNADLLLFPSLFEEWGYVAAESALHGTPVVTLPVYPFAEMLAPPLGFRAAGPAAREYADAIGAALRSGSERSGVAELAERRFGLVAAGQRLASIWAGDRGH